MPKLRIREIGEVFDGPHATPKRREEGKYFLNISSLQNGRLILDESDFIDDEDFQRWTRRVTPRENDLLFSYETRLGEAALMPPDIDAALGRRMALLRPNPEVVDPTFLLYYWLSPKWQQKIAQNTLYGATVNRLPITTLPNWEITLPELKVQRPIGRTLASLDDKISANSRVIQYSAQLSITLVNKAMTKEFENLTNLADITMGSSPKGEFLNEEGIGEPFFQGVRDFGELFPSERVFAEKAVRTAQEGDILFAVRAPIGEVNIAERPCVIGRGIAAIRGKQSHLGLFYLLKGHPELWETYQSSGTVFAGINKSDLHNAVIPVLRDSEKLEQQLTPIHERAMHALRENQVLARTRDELLPLLMSGRITVGEAEDAADEAASES